MYMYMRINIRAYVYREGEGSVNLLTLRERRGDGSSAALRRSRTCHPAGHAQIGWAHRENLATAEPHVPAPSAVIPVEEMAFGAIVMCSSLERVQPDPETRPEIVCHAPYSLKRIDKGLHEES